jgi:hypothetical protein
VPLNQFSEGYAVSNDNPALASMNGTLYLAFNENYQGNQNNYIATTTDGLNWSLYYISTGVNTIFSPSLAINPADSSQLYVSYMSAETYTPILCTLSTANLNTQSCQNLTFLHQMNFQPGMTFYNGLLYMGFEDRGNSHCLYFYQYNPSANSFSFWDPLTCGEQTSAAPALSVYNGDLFVAFRTNDSSNKFTVRISTDGNTLPYRQQPGFGMAGPGALVPVTSYQGSPAAPYLLNLYQYLNRLYYTYGQ